VPATASEIEALYRARSQALLNSATAYLGDGDAALEVVQETFALALRGRGSFRGKSSLETWVWRIMLNAARDWQRRSRNLEVANPIDQADEQTPELADELRSMLLSLPERQRLAVFLRYYADLSYRQIADVLEITPGTVAASLHAAHAALRQEMEVAR
jgi:RNA polymerase sigma-70 factor, ECF subfamily